MKRIALLAVLLILPAAAFAAVANWDQRNINYVPAQPTYWNMNVPVGLGMGSTAPNTGVALDLGTNTNSMLLPVGTTGQRPTGIAGMLRYNSTLTQLEGYINGLWAMMLSGSNGVPTCGTNCTSIGSAAYDASGTATSGVGVTSMVVNWSGTLGYTPKCVCGQTGVIALAGCATSTTALTVSFAGAVTSDVVTWICTQ